MRQDLSVNAPVVQQRAGSSPLLSRLYRDVGLAAVAAELDVRSDAMELDVAEAIERGVRQLAAPGEILAA